MDLGGLTLNGLRGGLFNGERSLGKCRGPLVMYRSSQNGSSEGDL